MRKKPVIWIAGATACLGAALVPATAAFGVAQTGSAAGMPFDLGPSPVGLPASCPCPNGDANFVFVSGNTVSHDSSNANGDWGGQTAEGTAIFYEGSTPLYEGHLTIWGGGGNNAKAQTEGGLTLDFHGSGPGGTLTIHVNFHQTTNAQGTLTASPANVNVSCSS
jgi:hypothetical protein